MEELTTQGLQRYGQRGEAGLTSAWDRMQTMVRYHMYNTFTSTPEYKMHSFVL